MYKNSFLSFVLCFLLGLNLGFAQEIKKKSLQELSVLTFDSLEISGTLLMPKRIKQPPLVIIISGSGPTDRDGNQIMMKNNSLKYLAEALRKKKIASFRFDKRGVGKSLKTKLIESDLRFEHYIRDVQALIRFFKNQEKFSSVTVMGHSEGSLIGMIASGKEKADAFISIAGVGRTADKVLLDQLGNPKIKEKATPILDSLKNGFMVEDIGDLKQLFRKSVQPYMISWLQYSPQQEIVKLKIPTLIVQGDNDIQVKVSEANLLQQAKPDAKLVIVSGMNHVLKTLEDNVTENLKSYYNPDIPVSKELIKACVEFINLSSE